MWVGLFAEDPVEGSSVGRTVQAVLRLQYERMRDGDRFWFENPIDSESNNGGYFTEEEIEELRQTTLAKIISLNTDIPLKSELEPGDDRFALPDNVFFVEGVIPDPGGVIKLEAEDLFLDTYLVENNSFASGEALISLRGAGPSGTTGTASGEFTGPSGLYDVVVGYFDDNDGKGLLRFSVNDNLVDNWSLDQDLGFDFANDKTFQQRTIGGVELNTGDKLAIQGTSDVSDFPVGDFARVDFFKLLPQSLFGTDTPFQSLNAGPAGLA